MEFGVKMGGSQTVHLQSLAVAQEGSFFGRTSTRCGHALDREVPSGSEDGIKGSQEVGVAIVDQETRLDLGLLKLPDQVPRLLGGPGSARVLAAGGEQGVKSMWTSPSSASAWATPTSRSPPTATPT
jgi:hypothetical protein